MKSIRPYSVDELRSLFIDQNLSAQTIANRFNIKRYIVETDLKKYNIKKPAALKHVARKVLDKEKLYQYYIVDDHTMTETAKFFGVGEHLVRKYCRLYGYIKDRQYLNAQMTKVIDKEELERFYIEENHSNDETAKHFNVNERTLRRKLREFNIYKSVELQVQCSQNHQKEKYGDLFTKSKYYRENVLEKMLERVYKTCEEKYGEKTYLLTKEGKSKCMHKYYFDDLVFDSSWELALYIYAIDHNESITREPVQLEYYVGNVKHYYIPDFLYNGQLIDIKGDHLLDEQKNLHSVFLKDHHKDQKKQECMKKNNVLIYTIKDIQSALDYVKEQYGPNYLKTFKKRLK